MNHLERAAELLDDIDASVFNGDVFNSTEGVKLLELYVSRWQRELGSIKEIVAELGGGNMVTCRNCGGDMLGDGFTEVMHCENAEEESYRYETPDSNPVLCTEGKDND